MALDLNTIQSAGLKLGNYNASNDSAILYQPGNGYNAEGTRWISGVKAGGIDPGLLGQLDQGNFSSGRSLSNMGFSDLGNFISGYTNAAASQALGQSQEAASRGSTAPQATPDAYGTQLAQALKSGQQPAQIAPGVTNPFATNSSPLNTASTPGSTGSKYQNAFNQNQTGNVGSSANAGNIANQNQSSSNPAVDNFLQSNPFVQQTNQQLMDFLQPSTTQATLQNYITQLGTDRAYLSGLNTELMNNKNIISGTEQDIRDEITKANGFATDSQVVALASARNKTLIEQDKKLADLITSAQSAVSTDTTLLSDERQMAQQETQTRMSLLQYQQKNNEFMFNAANDTYKTLMEKDPTGLYNSLLADPKQAQRFTSITGLSVGSLKGMGTTQELDTKYKQAEIDKIYSDIGGASGTGLTVPVKNDNSSTTYVPTDLAPYYNTSHSGVGYIDASTLEGTASQKTKLINEATKAGFKVITNKNTAADLINIKDAHSKLDTIQTAMQGIGQPNWMSRLAGGLGITWLETATQSDPQKAAAGILQSAGLDILKAISGVQGFRGNQTAVQQVTDHLPKVTDTVDTINQKVNFVRQLISDREDAAVGKPSGNTNNTDQIVGGVTYTQHADGLYYPK